MPSLDYPHISKAHGQPARLTRIPRVRVGQIAADYLGFGWSAEEIGRHYSYLSLSEIHSALAYYFDHQEEIETELGVELAELDRDSLSKPSPLRLRLLALRRGEAA